MAIYKYDDYVRKNATDPAFDGEHRPGATAPLSGIYRCVGCGREDISKEGIRSPRRTTTSTQLCKGLSAGVWLCLRTIDLQPDRGDGQNFSMGVEVREAMSISMRFGTFLDNIRLTDIQTSNGKTTPRERLRGAERELLRSGIRDGQ